MRTWQGSYKPFMHLSQHSYIRDNKQSLGRLSCHADKSHKKPGECAKNAKSRAGPSSKPSLCKQVKEENQASSDPSNCLMWFPRKMSPTGWTGACQQFHHTTLDSHISEKLKNDSSWICFPYPWVSWQMHRTNHSQPPKRMSFCYGCCKSHK